MKTTRLKLKRTVSFFLSLILLLCLVLSLCACNNDSLPEADSVKDPLYFKIVSYDEAKRAINVEIYLNKEEGSKLLEGVKSDRLLDVEDGFWFDTYRYDLSFENAALFSALNSAITPDERQFNSQTYENLNVNFVYATIYKSYKSNAVLSVKSRTYTHRLAVNAADDETHLLLTRDNPNSENWYGVLLGVGLALCAIATVIIVVGVKNKNKGKRNKNGGSNEKTKDTGASIATSADKNKRGGSGGNIDTDSNADNNDNSNADNNDNSDVENIFDIR